MINFVFKIVSRSNLMDLKKTKKNLNTQIKIEMKKYKLEILTYENDFLIKNLKKAG